jgi:hypothetical protein
MAYHFMVPLYARAIYQDHTRTLETIPDRPPGLRDQIAAYMYELGYYPDGSKISANDYNPTPEPTPTTPTEPEGPTTPETPTEPQEPETPETPTE